MTVGTKSVLFGAHCFFLHPWFVLAAWWKIYGFPRHPALWLSFLVHDLGYIGKPNMDGPEGEEHPRLGASIVGFLFGEKWHDFCLYHSRYLAKKCGAQFSRLCVADKLAIAITPRWLYLPMVNWTGEIREYLKNAQTAESSHWKPTGYDQRAWHDALVVYMRKWVTEHRDGRVDTWTSTNRQTLNSKGVWE